MLSRLLKGKVEEAAVTVSVKQEVDSGPEQELDVNVSDDDHISNRVLDSNVRVGPQFNPKLPEVTEVQPNIKNPVTKFVQIQSPGSPGGRSASPKSNISPKGFAGGKFAFKEANTKDKPAKNQFTDEKTETEDPETGKKPANLRVPKDVIQEQPKSGKLKIGEQNVKSTPQKTISLLGKNEKSSPQVGFSADKKDRGDEDSELPKRTYPERLNQQNTRSPGNKTQQSFELVLSPYASKEIENRKNTAQRELQEALAERLLKQGEILNEHSKALIEAYLQKEFQECTFNPMINAYGNYENKRTKSQFLEDQNKFLNLIELKKQKIKSKIESEQKLVEGTYKPELCKKSLKILEKKKKSTPSMNEDVHSRLYKVNKNAQQKQMQEIAQNEETLDDSNTSSQFIGQLSRGSAKGSFIGEGTVTFVPKIHKKSKGMKRESKIDTILYNDAMRRVKKSLAHAKKPNKPKQPANNMSEESRKALASRFIREFEIVLAEILEGDKEQKMDYIKLNEFLKKLYFLKDADKVDLPQFTPERILLYDLWYTMYADKFKGAHRRNLLVFLLAVMGLNYQITKIQKSEANQSQTVNAEENEEKKGSKNSLDKDVKSNILGPPVDNGILPRERRIIGNFDEDENWELTAEDVEKIHKVYNLWFVNRLGSKDNLGNILTSKRFEEPSYHPVINENSKNIAHLYREKILEGTSELIQQNKIQAPKDGKLTHADLLVLSKKVVKEKVEKFKASQEGNELRFCTFKPMTNDYSQSTRLKKDSQIDEADENDTEGRGKNAPRSVGKERAFELYALRKPTIEKKNRDALDIEYEKNCDQCTFQPDLRLTQEAKIDAGSPFAKNIEKTIQRLRQANDAREQKNLWNQRGYYPQPNEPGLVFGLHKDSKFKQGETPSKSTPRIDYKKVLGESPRGIWSLRALTKGRDYLTGGSISSSKDLQGRADPQYNGEEEHEDHDEEVGDQFGHEDAEEEGEHEDYEHQVDQDHEGQDEPGDHEKPDEQHHDEAGNERVPLLFVDVNLGQGKSERIIVYEGDKSEVLAKQFADEHGLDDVMAGKLKELLDSQIAGLLTRIDEELNSLQSETDKNEHGNMEVYRYEDQINEEDDQD